MSEQSTDLQKHVDTVVSEMQSLKIETDEHYTQAGEFLRKVKQTAKTVEKAFAQDLAAAKVKKQQAEAERKEVDKRIKAFTDQLDKAERTVKQMMSEYHAEQERKRREAEAQRRKAEEDARLEQAEETGDDRYLDAPVAPKKEAAAPKAEGTYTVDVWKYEIVDKTRINTDYLTPNEKAIGALVRSMKGDAQGVLGEGVRVYKQTDVRART